MVGSIPPLGTGREARPSSQFSIKSEVHGPGVFPQHDHDYFEALLILSGRRVQHIGMNDINADEGHILFMPPGVQHGATLQSRSVTLLIGFSLSFLHPELSPEATRAWDHPATLEAAPELLPFVAQPRIDFSCSVDLTKRIQAMATELVSRSSSQELAASVYARAQLSLLLLEIVRAFEGPLVDAANSHRPSPNSEGIDRLMSFIRHHLADQVSVDDAAKHLNISPSCLSARIKRATGKTFGDLLGEARLLRAKELLVYSDNRISEVAYSCGFDDHAYFSRRFRQVLGVTPGEYRRQAQMGNIGDSRTSH